tara:strand:- start:107393 stop:107950 length:558 start_codon:yes stop_codon:yes gene_type:complete
MRILFLLSLFIFTSCAMRSGRYVYSNGKWVFKSSNVGLFNEGGGYSTDYRATGDFIWPVPSSKKISSHFGKRGSRRHEGIDIPARHGSNILAARGGKVTFSGRMRGYGNIVVVKHDGGYHTVYAHNSKNYAKKGQRVSTGEVIALVGNTGRSTGSHLHFEVRKNNVNQNPMAYYKKSGSRTIASK